MDICKKFGARVKELREAQKWSQEELADRTGLHRTYISAVERGVRNPTITVIERISIGLQTDLESLMARL